MLVSGVEFDHPNTPLVAAVVHVSYDTDSDPAAFAKVIIGARPMYFDAV